MRERETVSEGRSKRERLRDGREEKDRRVCEKKQLKCIVLRAGKGE